MNNFNLIPRDSIIIKNKSTCWFQPTWKIVVKIGIFPQVGVKRKKNIWDHHLDGPILSSHEHHCFPWRSWPSNEQTNQYPTTRTSVVVSLFRLRCIAAPILGGLYIHIYIYNIDSIWKYHNTLPTLKTYICMIYTDMICTVSQSQFYFLFSFLFSSYGGVFDRLQIIRAITELSGRK